MGIPLRLRFLLILTGLLSGLNLFAQDIILRTDKTLVIAVIDEITPTEVIYRDYSNQKGPQLRMHKSYIQKIQYQNGYEEEIRVAPLVSQSSADGANPNGQSSQLIPADVPEKRTPEESFLQENASALATIPLTYRHKGGDFFLGQKKLSETEMSYLIGLEQYHKVYAPAQHWRRASMSMMISGGCVVGCGLVFIAGGVIEKTKGFSIAGGVVMASGAAVMTAGAVIYARSKKTLNNLGNEYNATHGLALSAGVSPYGIGLALKF